MFCTQCGRQLKENQKFCTNCGSSVKLVASPAASSHAAGPEPPPINVGRPPAFRSSPVPAEAPATVAVSEFPRPTPVATIRPPQVEVGPGKSGQVSAPRKAVSPLLMWGGIGGLALVVAVAVILSVHSSVQPTVSDEQIEKSIQTQFFVDPNLKRCAIAVRSQNGVVTIAGYINSSSDRSTASQIVLRQPGVKKVVDNLVSTPPPMQFPTEQIQTEAVSSSPSHAGSVKTVTVAGNRPWTDTGVDLSAGETVSVNASGSVSFSRGGQAIGPQGDQPSCAVFRNPRVPYVARDLRCHSLIGRIGSPGTFFEVGASTQFRAPVGGRLYLGVNDNFFPDNSGNWTAVISEQGSGPVTATTQQGSNPGTLRLFEPQIDPSARRVVLNGVDTARPSVPYHFDWGDGTESVGFFPQTKIYDEAGRTYRIRVVASYPDGSQGSAETVARIP